MNRKKYKYDFNCTINQSTQPQKVSIILKEDEIENKAENIKELVALRIKEILIQTSWLKKWDKVAYQAIWVSELKNPREFISKLHETKNSTITFWNNTSKRVASLLH